MMRLAFLSIALSLHSADAQKGNLHSEEQTHQVTISTSDAEALQLIRDIDMDLLKKLSAQTKAENTGAAEGGNRRMQRRGRRKSRQGGVRQLSTPRRLQDVAVVCDTMWLLICGTFVFFMHAGFAMLEAGTARAKNVQAILIKNLITVCMGTLGWYFLGWSLAYGGDTKTVDSWKDGTFEDCPEAENPMGCGDGYADNGLIGGTHMFAGSGFLGKGEAVDKLWAEGTIDPAGNGGGQAYMWFFQWAFCTAGASIVSGGIAERVKFPGYMFFSFCMTAFIYPVVVCSTWGYGWLETFKKDKDGNAIAGYIDFAGSGVVHLCGGVGALAGAAIVGKRKGRFDPEHEAEFQPHSQPFIVLGTFILWFGWCGFNSGSTLGMSDSGTALVAAHVMMNTTLSAATGGLTVFVVQYAITKKYDCAALCNGILAGLVSITAGCSNVESGSAVLIGALGGCIFVGSSALVKKAKIDDPEDGETKYMTTADALSANVCEIVFVIAWSGGLSSILFGVLRVAKVLRIDEDTEEKGCDHECASPSGYNIQPSFCEEKVKEVTM